MWGGLQSRFQQRHRTVLTALKCRAGFNVTTK
jgi:hypothetical protein